MKSSFDSSSDLAAKVNAILNEKRSLKAKKIATALGVDRSEVSSFLHSNKEVFIQNPETFEWSLVKPKELIINFPEVSWLDSNTFEQTLSQVGSPLESQADKITFIIGNKCSILLEAASRFLALCNQLIMIGKTVTVDFSACKATLHYFDRIGFCDLLDQDIEILPSRPKSSKAKSYKGNSNNLTEFDAINPISPDHQIPRDLQKTFISHAGEAYSTLALTVLSEPFNNVHDHSNSPINGFAALQLYNGNKKHIQTVISDSGIGIAGSLRPVLADKYPSLQSKFSPRSIYTDVLLIKEVFENGGISKVYEEARGLGLNRTFKLAVKYNANISIC